VRELHRRLTNVSSIADVMLEGRTRAQDLTDAHFLSCAAGYADVVVGERRHAAYLAADCAHVCRTLVQAAARLTAVAERLWEVCRSCWVVGAVA
jgi:hypothetical protein